MHRIDRIGPGLATNPYGVLRFIAALSFEGRQFYQPLCLESNYTTSLTLPDC